MGYIYIYIGTLFSLKEGSSAVCDSMEEPENIALTEKIKSETDRCMTPLN